MINAQNEIKKLDVKKIRIMERFLSVDNVDKINFFVDNLKEVEADLLGYANEHPSYLECVKLVAAYRVSIENYEAGADSIWRVIEMCEKIIKAMARVQTSVEKHSLYCVLRMDLTTRLLSERHGRNKKMDVELEKVFMKALNRISDICQKRQADARFEKINGFGMIKRGLFTNNLAVVEEGMEVIRAHFSGAPLEKIEQELTYHTEQIDFSYSMKELNIIVGGNVRRFRVERRLSVTELAQLLGMSNSSISYIEQGTRSLTVETAIGICKIFEISINQLFEGAEDFDAFINMKHEKFQIWSAYIEQLEPEEVEILINRGDKLLKYRSQLEEL